MLLSFPRLALCAVMLTSTTGCAPAAMAPKQVTDTTTGTAAEPAHLTVSANRDYLITGEPVRLNVSVQDRYANAVAPRVPVTFTVLAGPAQVTSSGVVTRVGNG